MNTQQARTTDKRQVKEFIPLLQHKSHENHKKSLFYLLEEKQTHKILVAIVRVCLFGFYVKLNFKIRIIRKMVWEICAEV
jgi:hypothetical protein